MDRRSDRRNAGLYAGPDDWTIAIALVENGAPTLAAVVNPVRGEAFEARAGAGAFLNGWRIHASERSALEGASLVVPEPLLDNKRWATPWPQPAPLWVHSMLYRLALVASGKADASFAMKPKWEWDVAGRRPSRFRSGRLRDGPSGVAAPVQLRRGESPWISCLPAPNCTRFCSNG